MTLFEVTQYVCLPIIIGILTLAFPILLQSISRIDEKYNTSILNKRFKKEWQYQSFNGVLYISLIYVFIHFVFARNWHWTRDCGTWMNEKMPHSSSSILIFFTFSLVAILILLINRIMVYYDHSELLTELRKKVGSFENEDNEDFNAFILVCNYNIEKNDEGDDALSKLYEDLKKYAKSRYEKKQAFSKAFYYIIKRLNKKLCEQQFSSNAQIKGNELLNVLLPQRSSPKDVIISKETYHQLADALNTQLKYGKTDWVYAFWGKLSQFRKFYKDEKRHIYRNLTGDAPVSNNQEKDDEIIQSNQSLIDFQIQLAAMVLHKEEYELLGNIFSYSQSQRSRYPYVPSTFTEIFTYCIRINVIPDEIPFRYNIYFPIDAESIKIHEESRDLIFKYLALLLFRLNTERIGFLSFGDQWKYPKLPSKLIELKKWQEYIRMLQEKSDFWDENNEHKAFKTFEIDKYWASRNNPYNRLTNFFNYVALTMDEQRKNLKLDKTEEFIENTKNIFEDNLSFLKTFTNNIKAENSDLQKMGGGQIMRSENEAFNNNGRYINPVVTKLFASRYVESMNEQFAKSFILNIKEKENTSYGFSNENALEAIHKLVGKNEDNFIVINISMHFDIFLDENISKIDGLLKVEDGIYKYCGIEIRLFKASLEYFIKGYIIVVPKDKLPFIEDSQPTEEELQAYFLNESNKIDNELSLYAGITKAKDNEAVRKELLEEDGINEENVDIYCLESIYSQYNIYWAKDTTATLIKVLIENDDNEVESNLEDVTPLSLPKEVEKTDSSQLRIAWGVKEVGTHWGRPVYEHK